MKLFFKSITVATVVAIIFAMIPFSARCKQVNQEVFRLHILANSDSDVDQKLKLKVRDKILEFTEDIYKNAENSSQAECITKMNLDKITEIAQKEIYKNGFNYPVKAEVCNMFFDTRYYERVTMPSGNYNSLRITIGKAQGKNWWCVMYPALCIGTATNYDELEKGLSDDEYKMVTTEKYQFKFKTLEYFEKICNLFS